MHIAIQLKLLGRALSHIESYVPNPFREIVRREPAHPYFSPAELMFELCLATEDRARRRYKSAACHTAKVRPHSLPEERAAGGGWK